MVNRILLFTFLVFVVSCIKEKIEEYATGDTNTGIVGKWKMIETRNDNGAGEVHVMNKSGENYIMTFKSNGQVNAPGFSCEGEYSFTPKSVEEMKGANLIISFDCNLLPADIETLPGRYYAVIRDNHYLSINNEECDESCVIVYRRLKD